MKRCLISTMLLAVFGLALAGPPVDVPLVCGEAEDAPIVGVASLVEDQLHMALTAEALEACTEGVYGVVDGEPAFIVTYTLDNGVLANVQVAFTTDPAATPSVSYAIVPEVAVEGMLGAQRNRAAAFERSTQAREQAREQDRDPADDATATAPGAPAQDRDQDQAQDQDRDPDQVRDQDRDGDGEHCDDACEGEAFGGPPTERPLPAAPRRP